MAGFKLNNFGGVTPRIGSRLLPQNGAQTAQNVKLFSGELTSWLRTTLINTPSKGGQLKSMYRMYATSSAYTTATGDFWLAWVDDVDVVKGPIAGDATGKLYYTGDTTTATNSLAGPRKTNLALATVGGTDYPHDYLEMGVPAPGSAPSVIGTGGTSTTSVTRVYAYTYVTNTASWSEEGPPSATGTGTGKSDASWVISGLSTGTTGKYAFSGGIKRIYRTLTDSAGNTNYQLALDNVPMSSTSTSDLVSDSNLGAICPTFINGVLNSEWVAPPSDMQGILALPNGIMVGFSKNLICFSEPFYPHAWPIRYRLATNYDIVSIGFFGQTLIVTTKGFPYAVIGARPDAMSMARIEENHPCVSKRSTVSFPFGVAWATPDGLALAGVGGTLNVIEPFMKRDEWRAQCYPNTLIAHQFQNTYFGFFNNGSVGLNFVFDRANAEGPLTFGNYDVQGAWNDPETSKLYLMQGGSIYAWDSDSLNKSPFDWKSKTFVLPNPVNFGAVQVEADYASFNDSAAVAAQIAADLAINTSILGTGESDTANLTAWATGSVYTTGDVRKSIDGKKMIICVVGGTSTSTEMVYPGTLGGTATDAAVRWRRIWDVQGVTKGEGRGHLLRGYIQLNSTDSAGDGPSGINRWGFPTRGSLLVGGTYANYDSRSLLLQVYAITTVSTSTGQDTTLVNSQYLSSREPVRLPRGFKSDTWEIRLSGNVTVRYFKIAETMDELGRIG